MTDVMSRRGFGNRTAVVGWILRLSGRAVSIGSKFERAFRFQTRSESIRPFKPKFLSADWFAACRTFAPLVWTRHRCSVLLLLRPVRQSAPRDAREGAEGAPGEPPRSSNPRVSERRGGRFARGGRPRPRSVRARAAFGFSSPRAAPRGARVLALMTRQQLLFLTPPK